MPNFNILRTIGGLRTSPRPAPIITKDFVYDTSQPITDPSLGRRGTLKKKNKHRYHISEDVPMAPMVLQSELQYPQDDVFPGFPTVAHQSSGYEHASISTSILPEKYPFPYEDNRQQRFQVNTSTDSGTPMSGGISGSDNGLPITYPDLSAPRGGIHPKRNGRHHSQHHRHHHHCRQSQSPQRYEHEIAYPTPPTHGYSHSSPKHTSWEPEHSRSRSRSNSRSFTPIPSVYREPDSMGDPYADPMIQEDSAHLIGTNGHRRSLHHSSERLIFELDQDHGPPYTQQPAMIEWLSNTTERQVDEEPQIIHDPEATLVGESEPQIISPPVRRENRNVYRTCEPDHEPNASYLRQRAPAQNHTYEHRRHEHGRSPEEPRVKIHTPYRDHHYSSNSQESMNDALPLKDPTQIRSTAILSLPERM